MARSPARRSGLGAVLAAALVALGALAVPGAALASTKKKHSKHAPAGHHTKHHGSKPASTESAPTEEAAPAEPGEDQAQPEHAGKENGEEGQAEGEQGGASEDTIARPPRSRGSSAGKEKQGESEEQGESAGEAGPRLPPALRGGIGPGAVYRTLTWTGGRPSGLADYSMPHGPELGGWLEVYPGAFIDRGLAADIGAILSFNRGFGISSTSGTGLKADAIFEDFLLGLKTRFPLGMFTPHVSAGYGGRVFLFSPRLPEVPSVFYSFVRLAGGARAQIGNTIDVEAEVAYLAVVDSGKQAGYIGAPEYFPGLGNYGLEAGGSIGVRVTGVFGLRGGVDFSQFALDLTHATGMLKGNQATDRYLTIWGGVEIVLDGAGESGAAKPRPENRPPSPPIDSAAD
ncbi:MAG TPA: hypothetical protein VHM31_10310 [Polyangia bacterium]|nr:hypothetical protein [Polyangia bacterium]